MVAKSGLIAASTPMLLEKLYLTFKPASASGLEDS